MFAGAWWWSLSTDGCLLGPRVQEGGVTGDTGGIVLDREKVLPEGDVSDGSFGKVFDASFILYRRIKPQLEPAGITC